MTRVWALARLTLWEGIRMRIVLVFLAVLVFMLLIFPTALHGDGTVAGRLQNFLAYSLGAVGLLLGVATLFLSCATLSQEIRYKQIHLVATKPVARLQILLGKWLGINLLNVILLLLCGLTIYSFARIIRNQPETNTRDRANINDVVWTARSAASPVRPEAEWKDAAQSHVAELLRTGQLAQDPISIQKAFDERYSQEEINWRTIGDAEYRDFRFENLVAPREASEVMQVRFKARGIPIPLEELVTIEWQFIDPRTGEAMDRPFVTEKRSAQRHQFLIRGKSIIRDGVAILRVSNPYTPNDPVRIQFDSSNALEILYKVGSFEVNFAKAVLLAFLQLAFVSAVGLFFSTFVSFPVACLCTATIYLIGLAHPFWLEAIGANMINAPADVDPYGALGPVVRAVLTPLISLFPDLSRFTGGTRLVEGEHISDLLMVAAALRTLITGLLALFPIGWLIFRERELAGVQV